MNTKLVILTCLFAFISTTFAVECLKPEITSKSFTTQDATIVSQIAYIAEFTLKCSNSVEDVSLFAEIDNKLSPVARVGPNQFQVSWNEEIKKARSGDHTVRLFDEEGFGAVRKAQRSGADTESVKSLINLNVRHPGAFKGPWIDSELFATGLAVGIAYLAFATRSKILS